MAYVVKDTQDEIIFVTSTWRDAVAVTNHEDAQQCKIFVNQYHWQYDGEKLWTNSITNAKRLSDWNG